ncbi:MAG: hypothetical protein KC425_20050 [Anaerolineales bacterium]|nr:hypothetical protein [Anaerolineales bacterium]
MSRRLVDQYPLGTAVEVLLADDEWAPGEVVAHAFPGVWVRTARGSWFVTNARRIRRVGDAA